MPLHIPFLGNGGAFQQHGTRDIDSELCTGWTNQNAVARILYDITICLMNHNMASI